MFNNKKGFTLIELLVVIAIIGILTSIVMVGVGYAKTRAKNAKIQAEISNLQTALEVEKSDLQFYSSLSDDGDDGNTVDGNFKLTIDWTNEDNENIKDLVSSIENQAGSSLEIFVNDNPNLENIDQYSMYIRLLTNDSVVVPYICIDSKANIVANNTSVSLPIDPIDGSTCE